MITLFYIGLVLVLIGQVWLVILALLNGRTLAEKLIWTVTNLVLQPITGIIFFMVKRTGLVPLLLAIIGTILMLVSYNSMMRAMIGMVPA
jgi:hypothetical protein